MSDPIRDAAVEVVDLGAGKTYNATDNGFTDWMPAAYDQAEEIITAAFRSTLLEIRAIAADGKVCPSDAKVMAKIDEVLRG